MDSCLMFNQSLIRPALWCLQSENIRVCHMMCDYSKYTQAVFGWIGNNYWGFQTVRFGKRFSHAAQNSLSFHQELNRALL